YLYHGSQPALGEGPKKIARGGSGTFPTKHASSIRTARLIKPSASTHVTDIDQTSIALDLKKSADGVTVTLPKNRSLVESGWYMLFVTDDQGTPSKARWVRVP
uniref:galactose oxidase early set domain-containing protein n=1 Tax=Streptomyces flavofungini TaxID=68200 RepID=UPI0034DED401